MKILILGDIMGPSGMRAIKERLPEVPVKYGYLEFAIPTLRDGLDLLNSQHLFRLHA